MRTARSAEQDNFLGSPPYGDFEKDQNWVAKGIADYNSGHWDKFNLFDAGEYFDYSAIDGYGGSCIAK